MASEYLVLGVSLSPQMNPGEGLRSEVGAGPDQISELMVSEYLASIMDAVSGGCRAGLFR